MRGRLNTRSRLMTDLSATDEAEGKSLFISQKKVYDRVHE